MRFYKDILEDAEIINAKKDEIKRLKETIKWLEKSKKEKEKHILDYDTDYEHYIRINNKYEFIGWGKPLNEQFCTSTRVVIGSKTIAVYKIYTKPSETIYYKYLITR